MILWHDAWKQEQSIAKQRIANTRSMEMRIRGDRIGTERPLHVNGINKGSTVTAGNAEMTDSETHLLVREDVT
jgi:hypothetical protein